MQDENREALATEFTGPPAQSLPDAPTDAVAPAPAPARQTVALTPVEAALLRSAQREAARIVEEAGLLILRSYPAGSQIDELALAVVFPAQGA